MQDRLKEVVRSENFDELLDPQLKRLRTRFQADMHQALSQALPATAEAAQRLQSLEDNLAADALERLLGADDRDRAVLTGLRQQHSELIRAKTPHERAVTRCGKQTSAKGA